MYFVFYIVNYHLVFRTKWNLRCTACTSFVFDEIFKQFPESNQAHLCPTTKLLFVVNVKMGLQCIDAENYTSLFIRHAAVRLAGDTHTPAPIAQPNPESALFILARFWNKYLYYTQYTNNYIYNIRPNDK